MSGIKLEVSKTSSLTFCMASVTLLQTPLAAMQMRVMPNTPCLIGQAASAYVVGTHATDDDAQKTYALMSSVGKQLHGHIQHTIPIC